MRTLLLGLVCGVCLGCGPSGPRGELPPSVSLAPPPKVQLRPAALSAPPRYAGVVSCAATGCHGDPDLGNVAWRTAYSVWSTRDPHAQAFRVLLTERSKRMVSLLLGEPAEPGSEPYTRLLRERCVGCHATPTSQAETDLASLGNGVSCESCHGPAGDWEHAHYLLSNTARREAVQSGALATLVDSTDRPRRARVCMGCHLGPVETDGRAFDMNHDLIAAGHPRLAFELATYFDELPPHWNVAQENERRGTAPHFSMWLVGQQALAEQQLRLFESRQQSAQAGPPGAWPELAQYECLDCHHSLQAKSWRQQPPSESKLAGWPEPQTWPVQGWIASLDRLDPPTAAAWREVVERWRGQLADWSSPGTSRTEPPPAYDLARGVTPTQAERVELVERWLVEQRGSARGWDALVQGTLAVRALLADERRRGELAAEPASVQAALSQYERGLRDALGSDGTTGPYDLPRLWIPPGEAAASGSPSATEGGLDARLTTLVEALTRWRTALTGGTR